MMWNMDINTFSVKLDWLQNKSFPSLSYEAQQLQEQREDSVTNQKQCVSHFFYDDWSSNKTIY